MTMPHFRIERTSHYLKGIKDILTLFHNCFKNFEGCQKALIRLLTLERKPFSNSLDRYNKPTLNTHLEHTN